MNIKKEMNIKTMKGIQCKNCNDRIFSFYRHDFKWCSCGNVFVDGGRDYLRYGVKDDNFKSFKIINFDEDKDSDKQKRSKK